MKHFSTRI